MDLLYCCFFALMFSFFFWLFYKNAQKKWAYQYGIETAVHKERERLFFDLQGRFEKLQNEFTKVVEERASLQTLLATEKEQLKSVQERFYLEFENLSNKIVKENAKEFSKDSQSKLEEVLAPLKQKIELFQMSLIEVSKASTVERLSLKNKIEHIVDSNRLLAEETHRLTRALKGDIKKQGAWGELVLQKVLEASGLRENQEYTVQGIGLDLSDQEGSRMQPDVIINLPHKKHIIIDSKMPYTHYDDYFNAVSDEMKRESLKKLLSAIKDHIRGLSEKNYPFLQKLDNPNFVLLFVPMEAIFSLVLEAEPSLFEEAWKKSVILVCPANLLAILRTIESLWQVERQNRNTQRIAEEGALLYDKFVDFLKDLDAIGKHIKGTQENFDKAMNKLSTGRGSLVKKTEDLKLLGLKTKKQIPENYLQELVFDSMKSE